MKDMIEPFLSAVPVLKKLEDAGFAAYFVGGSVRDLLLQKPIHDVDIATSATPEEMKRIFPRTVDIGVEHGTILVLYGNDSYEMTTFRTESEYPDFRRPKEVVFIRSLEQDLQRRDFTMNAIAMNRFGEMVDPFHGKKAIIEKRIETVGHASERFREDALRMLRAVRFMSQLGFEIAENTLTALAKQVSLLEKIAVERKKAEFEKLLAGMDRRRALAIILQTKIYSYLPELETSEIAIKRLLTYECDHLTVNEMWSLLIYSMEIEGNRTEHLLRAWRLPVKQIKAIQFILKFLKKRLKTEWQRYDLYQADEATVASVEKLRIVLRKDHDDGSVHYWVSKYRELPIKNRSQLAVSGSELIEWLQKKGGPWVNTCLTEIEQAVLQGNVDNQKSKIKEWLSECKQK